MKCYGRRLLEILLIVILLTGCAHVHTETPTADTAASQKAEQKEWNYGYHYGSDYWKYYDFSGSFISTQEDYETLVASYVPQIENLLGAEDWYTTYDANADTIFVNLEMGGTPHSKVCAPSKGADGVIEFSILLSFNQAKISVDHTLPHELTHSILGLSCFSNSLEEGMCDYMAARIGVNYT